VAVITWPSLGAASLLPTRSRPPATYKRPKNWLRETAANKIKSR
jgi:hypothetical protein